DVRHHRRRGAESDRESQRRRAGGDRGCRERVSGTVRRAACAGARGTLCRGARHSARDHEAIAHGHDDVWACGAEGVGGGERLCRRAAAGSARAARRGAGQRDTHAGGAAACMGGCTARAGRSLTMSTLSQPAKASAQVSLPAAERILLGPGPSPVLPRVMRAMVAPVLSHLDPDMLALLDDVRGRLQHLFKAPEDALTLAISGTGTAGMEAAVANTVREGTHVLVISGGYFGERLADMCHRYGAFVNRLDVPWGRAVDPDSVRRTLKAGGVDIIAMVHAETSTGV